MSDAAIAGLSRGEPVTVVLKWPANAGGGSRLVHTEVCSVGGDAFMANDDDRSKHRVADHGATWLRGHVALDGPEAGQLVRCAEIEDEKLRLGRDLG
jgi:hypothetical protein